MSDPSTLLKLPDHLRLLLLGETDTWDEVQTLLRQNQDLNLVQVNSLPDLHQLTAAPVPDLTVIDLNSFGGTSLELIEVLERQLLRPPLLLLIEESDYPDLIRHPMLRDCDYATHPVQADLLTKRIEVLLNLIYYQQLSEQSTKELQEIDQQRQELSERANDVSEELRLAKWQMEMASGELERLNRTLKLFVHLPLLNRMVIPSPGDSNPDDFTELQATVMFADIRSYTARSEQMNPHENFSFLNHFFNLMEPPILDNQGYIDKFIGDEIMAVFDEEDSHPNGALQAAIQMQQTIQQANQDLPPEKQTRFGIGLNTGSVMAGMLGSQHRMNPTVIGDHVNLASRLQGLTKKYQADILISESTYAQIDASAYLIREIDTVPIRGKQVPVTIYEVFNTAPEELREQKLQALAPLSRAIALYKQRRFEEALHEIYECLQVFPEDVVTLEYLKRCRYFQKYPPRDPKWDGVVYESDQLVDRTIWRQNARYALPVPLSLQQTASASVLSAQLVDLSLSGMKIELQRPLKLEAVLSVTFEFRHAHLGAPFDDLTCQPMCRVVWARRRDETAWEAGLEIILLPPGQEQALSQALSNLEALPDPTV